MENKYYNENDVIEKAFLQEKEIFIGEADELVVNCEGQPCNFVYTKNDEA
jgi:hypothetical protein